MSAKILTLDIETMSNLVWSWQVYSRGGWRAIATEKQWYPISFGAKWYKKKCKYYALEDYKGYEPTIVRHKDGSTTFRKPDTLPLMREAWKLLDEAEVVIGWNSKAFDVKKLNSYFLAHGMPKPSPFIHIDLMKEKTKLTSSNSNKLDDTGEEWGTGRKVKHEGFPLWLKCCEGDKKAQRKMKKYCVQDVVLTEDNFDHIKGWLTNLNLNVISQTPDACPNCNTSGYLKPRGWRYTKTNRYRQYRCHNIVNGKECGASPSSRTPEYKQAEERMLYK